MKKVIALKNIYDGIGKKMTLLVPRGTKGKVIDRYEWGPHRYIIVRFSNRKVVEFGDEGHPLISYKGFVGLL